MFGGAPFGCISACVSSFRVTLNSKGLFPSPTVTCSAEPSRLALGIGFGVLSSDGSARLNPPSSFSAIREGVTDPVKRDPSRTRIIVAKLLPSNIQCQAPANFFAVLQGAELACL